MDKSVQITLIIVSAFVLITLIGVFTIYPLMPTSTNTIRGNGFATIDVMPDLVTINFQVETKSDTLQEARDKNTEIVDALVLNLLKQGFERSDIQTTYYNIGENYVWTEKDGRKQEGYIAQHSLKVELSAEDTEKIGEVVDAGIDANASLSYINFELSTSLQNEYKAEAIKLAAQDAQIKAEALAEGLDKELGKLVSVSDSSYNYSPWLVYENTLSSRDLKVAGGGASVESQITPSEREISASVTAIFKIK